MASSFFFFNDTATTEIYTLSLHDALPICAATAGLRRHSSWSPTASASTSPRASGRAAPRLEADGLRSEEHTSELQSRLHLVCRLLLEKKRHDWKNHLAHQYHRIAPRRQPA